MINSEKLIAKLTKRYYKSVYKIFDILILYIAQRINRAY